MKKSTVVEVLTGFGVIISLIFVGFEIRANTNAVRGATLQGISDQSIETALAAAEIPEVRDGITKVFAGRDEDLTLVEEDALVSWFHAVMRIQENRFRQIELGTFDQPHAVGGGSSVYRIPFFQRFWEARGFEYPDDFREYVEANIIPLAMDSIPRLIQRGGR